MHKQSVIPAMGITLLISALAFAQDQVRPRYMTAEEWADALGLGNAVGDWIWECRPDLAGFTDPPPTTSRFPTEGEQTQGVVYGWPSYGCSMPELTELLRNSIGAVEVTVVTTATIYPSAISCLRGRGFTDDDLAQINWFFTETPFNTNTGLDVWIRDYGMEIVVAADGSFQFVDMGYYSGAAAGDCTNFGGRPNSDVSPTFLAPNFLSGVNVFRPALRTEGGNLQTDGLGTCVHNRRDVLAQNNFGVGAHGWRYSQDQLNQVYTDFYNCNVITLESFQLDPQVGLGQRQVIDHVDMYMTFISSRTVIVAQMDPEDAAFDPTNAAIMDANAQTLSDAGYNVVRIPQVRRYCTVRNLSTCVANPGAARMCSAGGAIDRVWATYANSIRVGNKMMVPVYRDVPAELADAIAAQEASALATFQATLDQEYGEGVVQVTPIVSDFMIPCQGSVHCISMTYGPPAAVP